MADNTDWRQQTARAAASPYRNGIAYLVRLNLIMPEARDSGRSFTIPPINGGICERLMIHPLFCPKPSPCVVPMIVYDDVVARFGDRPEAPLAEQVA